MLQFVAIQDVALTMQKPLSALEKRVMDLVWSKGEVTADEVRRELAAPRPLKDSTVRTIFRRLEQKGYVAHSVDGRTYRYRGVEPSQSVAAQAVRQIMDRFCNGSIERLLVGMVDYRVVDVKELQRLAKQLANSKRPEKA
jgi:BlaI family penicillinase repressor